MMILSDTGRFLNQPFVAVDSANPGVIYRAKSRTAMKASRGIFRIKSLDCDFGAPRARSSSTPSTIATRGIRKEKVSSCAINVWSAVPLKRHRGGADGSLQEETNEERQLRDGAVSYASKQRRGTRCSETFLQCRFGTRHFLKAIPLPLAERSYSGQPSKFSRSVDSCFAGGRSPQIEPTISRRWKTIGDSLQNLRANRSTRFASHSGYGTRFDRRSRHD